MKDFCFEIGYLCDDMQIAWGQSQTLSVEMQLLNLKIYSLKRYFATLCRVRFILFLLLSGGCYLHGA